MEGCHGETARGVGKRSSDVVLGARNAQIANGSDVTRGAVERTLHGCGKRKPRHTSHDGGECSNSHSTNDRAVSQKGMEEACRTFAVADGRKEG